MSEPPSFRRATPDDAALLAELVNYAGEGLPHYLWSRMTEPGETAWDVGRRRAAREEGAFSYRNATLVLHEGEAAGCLIGYPIPDEPVPIGPDMPALFRGLQDLENLAPGTWYVNVLAISPHRRGLGLGTALLGLADRTGRSLGMRGMSVIVTDGNPGARRLYERCGYVEHARRPIVKEGWVHDGESWVLLTKPI